MKVIDLLNKISNGEDVPTKIKFKNDIFRYTGCSYYCDAMCTTLFNIYNFSILNEKVKIIEEDKKIEKLPPSFYENACLTQQDRDIAKKINEIIDKINKME